jgi:phage-related protein (TIGR01555 family)
MSGRLVNVRPKPGFVLDHSGAVVPQPANVSWIRDGALLNVLTGRGTSVDKSAHNFWMRRFQTQQQVEAAYLGSWLHRKIVDIPAQDMTRAGRDWDAQDDDIAKIEAEEKRLGYWPKLREAVRLGRLGGGAIFIGLGDDPAQPLPSTLNAGAVKYLMVFSRCQLQLGDLDPDPASPTFGQPQWFRISGLKQQFNIHPSRMVCFHGLPIPATTQTTTTEDAFWGMSVVEAVDEAVQHATTATAGFAALIDEAKVDVFTMPGMYETLAQPGGEAKFMAALSAAAQGKSIHRMLALGEGETWETRQLTWAGMPDVIRTYMANVAGAADIPATRLLGKSPDGQNATGESDLANYYQSIGAKQEMDLRPPMERLDAVVLPSAGVSGADLSWAFSPLRVLSEKEQAEIEWQEAQTVEKLANAGLVPESALAKSVQNRLIESQRWPGLQQAIEEAEAAGEDLPEDDPELEVVPVPRREEPGEVEQRPTQPRR